MNSASITSAALLPANSRISSATGRSSVTDNQLAGATRSISSVPASLQEIVNNNRGLDAGETQVSSARSTASTTVDISAEAAEKARQVEQQEKQQQRIDDQTIEKLASRDREVRNHERAHAAVGGQYAGAPRYQYERGPDGVNYAISGEVSISTGAISGDRKVAAQATQMEAQARVELLALEREERLQEQAAIEQRTQEKQSTVDTTARVDDSSLPTSVVNNSADSNQRSSENVNEGGELPVTEANRRLLSSNINNAQAEPTSGSIISLFA